MTSNLSNKEIADLCALADGTLPVDRRAEVEAWVAASSERQDLLERQRRSLVATQALASEPVPDSLRQAVEARRRTTGSRSRRRRLAPRLGLATAFGVAVAIVAVVVLSSGPAGPTVAQAAQLATQPASAAAPRPTSRTELALGVQGVSFPNLASYYGWHASGVRHGHVGNRAATVVFYSKGARRIAYVIVSGASLARPGGGRTSGVGGVEYQTLRLNDKLAVTWQRGGHTCILLGQAKSAELLALAAWTG